MSATQSNALFVEAAPASGMSPYRLSGAPVLTCRPICPLKNRNGPAATYDGQRIVRRDGAIAMGFPSRNYRPVMLTRA